jgi:maltokinase
VHWEPESPGRMSPLEHALVSWLPRRRWFAGGGRDPHRVEIVSATELAPTGAARGALVLVEVSYPDGETELYQVPLGHRTTEGSDIGPAVIAHMPDGVVYDATVDASLMGALLAMIGAGATAGDTAFSPEPGSWVVGAVPMPGRPLGVEQSNTSIVFGDKAILKLFRRLAPGVNPELELHRAIAGARVPRLLGAIEGSLRGEPVTLGVLHEFAAGSSDGWLMATEAVGNLVSGVDGDSAFVADVELLGAAVGQVLRSHDGWLLTDFEGEPAAGDRLATHSPLRDVAGMLRSFDYAASQAGDAWSRYQLERWLARVRAAFAAGYGRESGVDLARSRCVLTAYELDKAVYEVAYETRNRPSWAHIPLRAVAAVLGG